MPSADRLTEVTYLLLSPHALLFINCKPVLLQESQDLTDVDFVVLQSAASDLDVVQVDEGEREIARIMR